MAYPALKPISPEVYLAEERRSSTKHHYFNGDVVAMAGASIAHNTIVSNLIREVGVFLKEKDCNIFPSDLRVNIPSAATYTYPDATIICGSPEVTDEQRDTVKNPTVIFEVLSATTREYDTSKKFLFYQRIPSLKEYILIDSTLRSVVIYRRQEDELWNIAVTEGAEGSLKISSIGFSLSFKELYSNVTLRTI
ncbi:Uma2 family endonuclease [Niabella yanshanensis]|uniref:Uma2 family endonuclease n=1 Tax=Niabella yanshanensis TaxID=577386 RepID=A0ABZ0W722_9BACT|nr:Uma2 family endonuclease [Niabella yanshanensis]WQD38464.1 Uma2 family endonuclease [Niabella yanshanensis]